MSQQVSASINMTVNPSLAITTASLPAATVGQAYSVQMQATGGVPPYTWTVANLAPGLSLSASGALSGTPTQNGGFFPGFTVKDSSP